MGRRSTGLLAALTAALALTSTSIIAGQSGTAAAVPVAPPPYVAQAEWAHWGDLSSLRVYPTPAGRRVAAQLNSDAEGAEAWAEVLALAPDADLPGMRAQFICHWTFAELVEPGKRSWNLEPWRPVVDENTMVDTRCNPGGTEEPF